MKKIVIAWGLCNTDKSKRNSVGGFEIEDAESIPRENWECSVIIKGQAKNSHGGLH